MCDDRPRSYPGRRINRSAFLSSGLADWIADCPSSSYCSSSGTVRNSYTRLFQRCIISRLCFELCVPCFPSTSKVSDYICIYKKGKTRQSPLMPIFHMWIRYVHISWCHFTKSGRFENVNVEIVSSTGRYTYIKLCRPVSTGHGTEQHAIYVLGECWTS